MIQVYKGTHRSQRTGSKTNLNLKEGSLNFKEVT